MDASPNKSTEPEPIDGDVVARLRVEARHGGKDFFPQYVEYFHEDLERAENELKTAASEKSASQLLQSAHRLRGAAGNFGAHRLIEFCVQVEKLAQENRVPEALDVLPRLQAELLRVAEAAQALRS
ncbi:Hpt protein [Chthoniobacter flavus Ellin428]|uniref:Hpt protein n=1 Tax=Chthoniobacter flavus Ellin428 TaxID=497964 RepID=B4CWB6_9BACT|nr:Hpt domain-containing protein [Chthoniobacter flavus]EDY21708.1 Hpt protein [Chthoniobacter flavus Ellin428]TCO95644.1 HPt (histidine-containing phosphotransfer) domain-containing protein [Chthoniobacter flavus]